MLSRRPTGTKLSADIAYINTSCDHGDRHGGLQAAFSLRVGTANFFLAKEWLQGSNKLSINLSK